jgi:hypothetical protein
MDGWAHARDVENGSQRSSQTKHGTVVAATRTGHPGLLKTIRRPVLLLLCGVGKVTELVRCQLLLDGLDHHYTASRTLGVLVVPHEVIS